MWRCAIMCLVVVAGCQSRTDGDVAQTGGQAWVRSELYFGRDVVDDAAWTRFVEHEITPRFPDGFTVLAGQGAWRGDKKQTTYENSQVVIIVHSHSPTAAGLLDQIRERYCEAFNQQSVLLVSQPATASFE